MKSSKAFVLLVFAGLVAGCASGGNDSLRAESESSVQTKIVEGKTTKADVRRMFGSPLETSFTEGGNEIWNYEFSNVSADAVSYIPIIGSFGSSASGTKKELVLLFSKEGVVQRFSMSESEVKHRSGVFNQ